MFKIDSSGSVNGAFVEEDTATGRQPTIVSADWLNAVQGEIASVIAQDGVALAKANSAQLAGAVVSLINKGIVAHKAESSPHPQYMTASMVYYFGQL